MKRKQLPADKRHTEQTKAGGDNRVSAECPVWVVFNCTTFAYEFWLLGHVFV